jgi:hypothetical protein
MKHERGAGGVNVKISGPKLEYPDMSFRYPIRPTHS